MKRSIPLCGFYGGILLLGFLLAVNGLGQPVMAAPGTQDGPVLTIVKTEGGNGTITRGQTLYFTIGVTNTGSVTATNVTVRDDFDQQMFSAIRILSEGDSGASSGQNDGDVITWQVGELVPGAGWSTTYETVAADDLGTAITEVTNGASVLIDGEEVARAEPVVLRVQAPQLSLTREWETVDGGEVAAGATIRHTIRYQNNGTAQATNVVLIETFDESVVRSFGNISGDGRRDTGMVRWSLGSVPAGVSGEVTYEATLKLVLPQDTVVQSEARISADEVGSVSAVDSFVPLTPWLSIERGREDLNGGVIEAGDTVRFTIRLRNLGAVAASSVVIVDDYAEGVVAEVSQISGGGTESAGMVRWSLEEPLEVGEEKTLSYEARLLTGIDQSTEVVNTAFVFISDVEVDRAEKTMAIEPKSVEEGTSPSSQLFREQPITIAGLIGILATVALLVIGGLAMYVLKQGMWKERYFWFVIEGVAVIAIVEAVLVLAISSGIESEGAVSILSGIAGYVLGRNLAGMGGGDSSSRPSAEPPPERTATEQ